MKKIALLFIALMVSFMSQAQKDFYELRVYETTFSGSGLHQYLENALLPALNRQGVKNIGAFDENGLNQPVKVYLFIPYKSMAEYEKVNNALKTDKAFKAASDKYASLLPNQAPYATLEVSMFTAFEGLPRLVKPSGESMLFELRTYQSYIEDAFMRKVKMFNEGELDIFKETGLHSVFFGEKIAGSQMPCLTYMLAFKDMEERNANWSKFSAHPEWKKMSALEEYANTVSRIERVFLKPLKYNQL